jgi:hypothetical protein
MAPMAPIHLVLVEQVRALGGALVGRRGAAAERCRRRAGQLNNWVALEHIWQHWYKNALKCAAPPPPPRHHPAHT